MPKKLIGQYALIQRLPPEHGELQKIREHHKNNEAGFSGERDFDKQMLEFKPKYPHAILHDICLKQDGVFFQMDSILITPASIIIFEVKNFGGKIVVKSNPTQFILEYSTGERKVMRSPITELDRKIFFLLEWLKQRKISIPIDGIVSLAFTNELNMEKPPETKVIFTYETPNFLRTLQINKEILGRNEIKKLALELKRNHQEYNPFPMTKTMNIPCTHILSGVICPSCNHRGMHWAKKKWNCRKCGHTGTQNHINALADWTYLIEDKITNKEFRNFTQLQSHHVAKRLLAKSNLTLRGKGSGSYYVKNHET